ncbi:hypothetical protein [Novosphingobium sp.]|uniref:hypothetical protein n=1 Tax=Novosphingobium sp. TaxID=1874826 RepID=UPI0038BB2064
MVDLATARNFISLTDLPAASAFAADAPASGGGLPDFDPTKEQSLVIGSDVISFGTGVDAEFRQAITDSALFAQLAALHKVGPNADPMKFFDAYFSYLLQLGWLVQQRDTSELEFKGGGLDVHQEIIGVITAFLAPIAGAAQAILAVMEGLRKMDQSQPFITLFNKRSARQKIGQFQFTYVQADPAKGILARMTAFGLDAHNTITQVLFFRLKNDYTSLQRSLGALSIDPATLTALRPNIAAKVLAYRQSLIAEVDLGPVGP